MQMAPVRGGICQRTQPSFHQALARSSINSQPRGNCTMQEHSRRIAFHDRLIEVQHRSSSGRALQSRLGTLLLWWFVLATTRYSPAYFRACEFSRSKI